MEIDFKTGSGRLIVPEGGRVLVESAGLAVEAETKGSRELAPGTYRIAFKSEGWGGAGSHEGPGRRDKVSARTLDVAALAGLEVVKKGSRRPIPRPGAAGFLAGDEKGRVLRFRGETLNVLFQVSSGGPLTAIRTAGTPWGCTADSRR